MVDTGSLKFTQQNKLLRKDVCLYTNVGPWESAQIWFTKLFKEPPVEEK